MKRAVLLLAALAIPAAARVKFNRDVRPILERHCVRCHGEERASRGVRLDRKERVLMIVVKGKPDDSRLYYTTKSGFMPPVAPKLSSSEQETIRKWIASGAR